MARMSTIAGRAEELLGTPVVSTTPVAGGDICTGPFCDLAAADVTLKPDRAVRRVEKRSVF